MQIDRDCRDPKYDSYLSSLKQELSRLNTSDHKYSMILLNKELSKVMNPYDLSDEFETNYFDIFHGIPIGLEVKIDVPAKGDLIEKITNGQGSSLKTISESSMCKIQLLGHDLNRGQDLEDEHHRSKGSKQKCLHLNVRTVSEPIEAFARIAYSLFEVKRILTASEISEPSLTFEQFRELGATNWDPTLGHPKYSLSPSDVRTLMYLDRVKNGVMKYRLLGDLNENCYRTHDVEAITTTPDDDE